MKGDKRMKSEVRMVKMGVEYEHLVGKSERSLRIRGQTGR
jgi:hypothetical protein